GWGPRASAGQLPGLRPQLSAAAVRTSATFPPETAMFVVPVASGVGRGAPTAAAEASWTRKCAPGATDPERLVTCHVVPAPEVYWTDQLPRSTVVLPRLNSSTKSFVYGAFALPPPAKT